LFEVWFERCLLKEVDSGSTTILDNATFHRKRALRVIASRYGCDALFLPPYSLDLDPIEKKWAWLKRKLRETLYCFQNLDDAIWELFQVR